jgi:FkbH-like protein
MTSGDPSGDGAPRARLALAGTFTIDPLVEALELVLEATGVDLEVEVTPYAQVFQELLDPGRSFARNRGGVNVVLVRIEDLQRQAAPDAPLPGDDVFGSAVEELVGALRQAAGVMPTPPFVLVCPPSPRWARESAGLERHAALEQRLVDGLTTLRTIRFVARPPAENDVHDEEGDRLGHVPYRPSYFAALALAVARVARARLAPPRKLLALDGDNTLWKGVVGEDGVEGLDIGARQRALQDFALAKKREGMLLAVVSKNVAADVDAVFSRRADMRLRADDLATSRVNWLPKSQNLESIAAELDLGVDSFVFIDDSPIECAEVAAACPAVLTVLLPEARASDDEAAGHELAAFLDGLWPLDRLDVTDEDRRRTELYRENRDRSALRESSTSLAEFLRGLELEVTIGDVRPEQQARAAQLTQRTNQFNFTTRRRNQGELEGLSADGKSCLVVQARDRFGDYGLVGLMILGPLGDAVLVDTFLLSCRILGRGVEVRMLQEAGRIALARGLTRVALDFSATAKNLPALRFLETLPATKEVTQTGTRYGLSATEAAAFEFKPAAALTPADARADETTAERAPRSKAAQSPGASSSQWARFATELNTPAGVLTALERDRSRVRTIAADVRPPRTATERRLVRIWMEVLRLPEVGVTDDFFELGGTSLAAVDVFARLERATGRRLPLTTLVECPTIEACAARIDERTEGNALVLLQDGGDGPPLFLVHDADGETLLYRNLARRLAGPQSIYALQPQWYADSVVAHTRLEDMAAHYVREIRKVHPEGPYLLGGLCAGGVLAFEMARQLEADAQEAHLVAVFDAADVEARLRPRLEAQRKFARFGEAVRAAPARDVPRVIATKLGGYLFYQTRARARRAQERVAVTTLGAYLDRDLPPPSWVRKIPVRVVYSHAEARYRPTQRLREEIVLFCATSGEGTDEPFRALYSDPELGWGCRTDKGVMMFEVPGGHGSMLQEPHVAVLADRLRERIADITGAGAGNGVVDVAGSELRDAVTPPPLAPKNGHKHSRPPGNNVQQYRSKGGTSPSMFVESKGSQGRVSPDATVVVPTTPGAATAPVTPAAVPTAAALVEPTLIGLLAEDLKTHDGDASEPGFWAVATHRIGSSALDPRRPRSQRIVLDALYQVMFRSVDLVWGIQLPRTTLLGRRVRLWHNGCILLQARSIGSDVHIRHDTTFGPVQTGRRVPGELTDLPTIEDGVDIGSGACIMGNVRVGRDAVVGANSVVLKDVPAGATVLGVPARIVPK